MKPALSGSIDLGTNTCLLLVARPDAGGFSAVLDRAEIVRLGQGVDQSRRLHPDAMSRTLGCLRGYAAEVRAQGLDPAEIIAVTTSSARDASNSQSFFADVERETGFRFRTLTGEQEARWTFEGALLPGIDAARAAVLDIGGGSTELTSIAGGGLSLDIGSVRFTERYFQQPKNRAVSDQDFWACRAAIDEALEAFVPMRAQMPADMSLVAVAGTATTLASAFLELKEFDPTPINRLTLTRGDLHRLVEELKWRSPDERAQLPGVETGRADVLLAGALILWRVLERLQFAHCRVSARGLRYGVLAAHARGELQ